jgi:hypothetical protein
MAVPTISTIGQLETTKTTITFQGEITATGGSNATRRGFQYNTVEFPDKEKFEDGSFGTGVYDLQLTGLTPGTTYYIRAFATNPDGTGYGSWVSVTTDAATYNITINSIDRTADVKAGTLSIDDIINDYQNTCSFDIYNLSGNGIPSPDEEISITLDDGTKIFGGLLVFVGLNEQLGGGEVAARVRCVDFTRLLDRNLVRKTYENETDADIIKDIIDTYAPDAGITTTNVVEGVTIDQISFNYVQISQAFRRIAELTGRNWYIDYDKDIHYFPLTTSQAPFDIDSSNADYEKLVINKDATQIKNRVYVRGGTKRSESTTWSTIGDGETRTFTLPDKPHDVTVTVNDVEETVGIKHIDDEADYDWLLNFQEKYLEQGTGGTTLTDSDTLEMTYTYDIPILVALEDAASIAEHGVQEFAIFDKQIATTNAARDRASAELTDYANNLIEGVFDTYEPGFVSGQYININLTDYDVNDDYIVQRVIARSLGGGTYIYTVSIASAKTLGIIKFLIELLESNRNIITLDDNEAIDELLNVSDSLLSDSLLDSLTIDSAGPYATWAIDSTDTSPDTRAVWELFQWG